MIKLFELSVDPFAGVFQVNTILGTIVSTTIVLEISVVVFWSISRNTTYTVLSPSPVSKLCAIIEVHDVQFVGFDKFP